MNLLIIEDEWAARKDLERTLCNVFVDPDIDIAANAEEAIEAFRKGKPDIVFLDIRLPGKNGVDLAKDMLQIHPKTNIIVTSGSTMYTLDAFQLFVCGYLVKPILESDVRKAVEHLRYPMNQNLQKLRVNCIGEFEVFWNDRPMHFHRSKTKELFAFLIAHNGRACVTEEIISNLWEDEENKEKSKAYLRKLIQDLRETLREIGMEEIVVRESGELSIRIDMIDRDYSMQSEKDDEESYSPQYSGYMTQYSWAEYFSPQS